MTGVIYCEGPGCERSAYLGPDTMAAGRFVPGFLRVVEFGNSADIETAYCGWDCLMRAAAKHEPEIEADTATAVLAMRDRLQVIGVDA